MIHHLENLKRNHEKKRLQHHHTDQGRAGPVQYILRQVHRPAKTCGGMPRLIITGGIRRKISRAVRTPQGSRSVHPRRFLRARVNTRQIQERRLRREGHVCHDIPHAGLQPQMLVLLRIACQGIEDGQGCDAAFREVHKGTHRFKEAGKPPVGLLRRGAAHRFPRHSVSAVDGDKAVCGGEGG